MKSTITLGVFRFQQLLAFSRKMADVAATTTDKRSVTLLTTYNTRSVHAVTQRAQQNLRHFTAIRPCFQQFAVDNVSRSVMEFLMLIKES